MSPGRGVHTAQPLNDSYYRRRCHPIFWVCLLPSHVQESKVVMVSISLPKIIALVHWLEKSPGALTLGTVFFGVSLAVSLRQIKPSEMLRSFLNSRKNFVNISFVIHDLAFLSTVNLRKRYISTLIMRIILLDVLLVAHKYVSVYTINRKKQCVSPQITE